MLQMYYIIQIIQKCMKWISKFLQLHKYVNMNNAMKSIYLDSNMSFEINILRYEGYKRGYLTSIEWGQGVFL